MFDAEKRYHLIIKSWSTRIKTIIKPSSAHYEGGIHHYY